MRWFVTGTDTGVGKTLVTACLAAAARRRGSVIACKPVASGVEPGTAGEDADLLGALAGHPPLAFATFAAPLSPHTAARLEGRGMPPDLLARIAALSADEVLVEGVGGWRVPLSLSPRLGVVDLARATGGQVIVVAADRLGVLNHTLLTIEAVRADGLPVAAVVLNQGAAPRDPSRATNHADLAALCDAPVVGFPPVDPRDPDATAAAGEAVWRAIVAGERGWA